MVIKDVVGDWIHEEEEVKNFIRSGFNKIYLTSLSYVSRVDPIILA